MVVVRCPDTPWLVGVTGEVVSTESTIAAAHPITILSERFGRLSFEADEIEPDEEAVYPRRLRLPSGSDRGSEGAGMSDVATCRAIIQTVVRWLIIRCEWGPEHQQNWVRNALKVLADPILLADVDHSALLERLLAGKAPLPIPPPLRFGYPWYDLVESGAGEAAEVHAHGDYLVICQYPWRILERVSDREYVVTYGDVEAAAGRWRVRQTGTHEQHFGALQPIWRIERLDGTA